MSPKPSDIGVSTHKTNHRNYIDDASTAEIPLAPAFRPNNASVADNSVLLQRLLYLSIYLGTERERERDRQTERERE